MKKLRRHVQSVSADSREDEELVDEEVEKEFDLDEKKEREVRRMKKDSQLKSIRDYLRESI